MIESPHTDKKELWKGHLVKEALTVPWSERFQKIKKGYENLKDDVKIAYGNLKINKYVDDAFKCLENSAEMKRVLDNLPEGLTYKFGRLESGTSACYSSAKNEITFSVQSLKLKTPEEKLTFVCQLAHELCHANQKKEGLFHDDLKNPKFSDVFTVNRIMELDAKLLEAKVGDELQKGEFSNVDIRVLFTGPEIEKYTDFIYVYQQIKIETQVKKYDENGHKYWQDDIKAANTEFINDLLSSELWTSAYNLQALQAAGGKAAYSTDNNGKDIIDVCNKYIERMSVNITAEDFASGKYDEYTKVDNNEKTVDYFSYREHYKLKFYNDDKFPNFFKKTVYNQDGTSSEHIVNRNNKQYSTEEAEKTLKVIKFHEKQNEMKEKIIGYSRGAANIISAKLKDALQQR